MIPLWVVGYTATLAVLIGACFGIPVAWLKRHPPKPYDPWKEPIQRAKWELFASE